MKTRRDAYLTIALYLGAIGSIQAAVTSVTAVQVDNSAGGPALADFNTYDILIDFEGNLRGQQMIVELTRGSIYQNSGDFGTYVAPLSALLPVDGTLAYDTFVTLGGPTLPAAGGLFATAGDFVLPGGAVNLPGGTAAGKFDTTGIDFAWAPGTGKNVPMGDDFMTVRITLSKDAAGTFWYFGSTAADTGPPLIQDTFIYNGCIGCGPPPIPPVVTHADLGQIMQGERVTHTFVVTGDLPITFHDEIGLSTSPGPPVIAPMITPAGRFSWDSDGSPLGMYTFDVTASNIAGSDEGSLTLELVAPPLMVVDAFQLADPDEMINHTFQAVNGTGPITWSDLTVTGPDGATPAVEPTLGTDGIFSWNTTDSPLGTWTFNVTASDTTGSDVGTLFVQLGEGGDPLIPEPSTSSLLLLGMLGLAGLGRKRF